MCFFCKICMTFEDQIRKLCDKFRMELIQVGGRESPPGGRPGGRKIAPPPPTLWQITTRRGGGISGANAPLSFIFVPFVTLQIFKKHIFDKVKVKET